MPGRALGMESPPELLFRMVFLAGFSFDGAWPFYIRQRYLVVVALAGAANYVMAAASRNGNPIHGKACIKNPWGRLSGVSAGSIQILTTSSASFPFKSAKQK